MKDVTERIAALSPDKQTMLLQRLKQKASQPESKTPSTHASLDAWIVG